MSKHVCRTRDNSAPEGKPWVYLAAHPDDLADFVREYVPLLLDAFDCAVWYETEYEAPYYEAELRTLLFRMDLVIMAVTEPLLTSPCRAADVEYRFAKEDQVLLLPVLFRECFLPRFTERFKDISLVMPEKPEMAEGGLKKLLQCSLQAAQKQEAYFKAQDAESRKAYFSGLKDLGDALYDAGCPASAETIYRRMLTLAEASDDDGEAAALCCNRLGLAAMDRRKMEEAKAWYQKSLEIETALARKTKAVYSRGAAIGWYNLGRLAALMEDRGEEEACYLESLQAFSTLTKENGTIQDFYDLIDLYQQLYGLSIVQRKYDRAEEYSRGEVETAQYLVRETGASEAGRALAGSYRRLGRILQARGRGQEAEECFGKAAQIRKTLAEETGPEEGDD